MRSDRLAISGLMLLVALPAAAADAERFAPLDVFELEWADDPQVTPDGKSVIYARTGFDIMTDRTRANIWIAATDGSSHRPILSGKESYRAPSLSPDGTRLAYISGEEGAPQIYVRWLDSGQTARLTDLNESPSNIAWSPDGTGIAFNMRVPADKKPLAKMPAKPEGAKWAAPVKVIESLTYRIDGVGYLEPGHSHIFVVPASGGTPRQVTGGDYNHGRPSWTPDGKALLFSANRTEDWEYGLSESEVHRLDLASGAITTLTTRKGPDTNPVASPDGKLIAWTGHDEEMLGYQPDDLYVMNADGSNPRVLTADFDRSVGNVQWAPNGRGLIVQYSDHGIGKIARVDLQGRIETLAQGIGGTSIGRPYGGGTYDIGRDGTIATLVTDPSRPAELAVIGRNGALRKLTDLNEDLLGHKKLAQNTEIVVKSSVDGRDIQGWYLTPPDFDPARKYPLLLEIHGGPFADYGPRFSAELQLYAAAGHVVVYLNPRGSTSYGKEFGNLIHHNYPSNDYDDLMDVVDGVIARGFVDTDRLYVTGGSGGGVLTAWIVGKTDRFRAAVVAKPVINWASFVLTGDFSNTFASYWFPAMPWEDPDHYWRRSPLSLVGNVTTPTMLLTGEVDYRTPSSEAEQYYQALKLRHIDTAMVRVPEASHGIANRPSGLIAKTLNILAWFDRHGGPGADD